MRINMKKSTDCTVDAWHVDLEKNDRYFGQSGKWRKGIAGNTITKTKFLINCDESMPDRLIDRYMPKPKWGTYISKGRAMTLLSNHLKIYKCQCPQICSNGLNNPILYHLNLNFKFKNCSVQSPNSVQIQNDRTSASAYQFIDTMPTASWQGQSCSASSPYNYTVAVLSLTCENDDAMFLGLQTFIQIFSLIVYMQRYSFFIHVIQIGSTFDGNCQCILYFTKSKSSGVY